MTPKFSYLAWTFSGVPALYVHLHPWHIYFIATLYVYFDFTCSNRNSSSFSLLPLCLSQPSAPQAVTTSSFQLLRSEAWELSLTFPFPLHLLCQVLECTQNLTISSHVVLPLASEAPTFLVWIYWKSLWVISLLQSLPPCSLFWT